jgi:citrate lyase subunit beta / citryl-CoA lyase
LTTDDAAVPLSWLYVPGDRPDRFDRAAASGADVVVVDLEDAVVPDRKERARADALEWLRGAAPGSAEVRVNALGSPWATADLAAFGDLPALRAVRLPKVESAADVAAALDLLAATRVGLVCLLETARGVEAAFEIASAHERVVGVGLGEADLRSDLGVSDDEALAWPRGRVVVAARAAGLPPPAMSVYPHVHDLTGLAASCRAGRRAGFLGRAAVHPRQVPVITESFLPTQAEVDDARAVVEALADGTDRGVAVLPDGRMVDAAMLGRARRVLALATRRSAR